MIRAVLAALFFATVVWAAPPSVLSIYWIDTEGDAATLVVGPTGQSLLIDSGSAEEENRDAQRIFDVASKEAGLTKIDYLVTTVFRPDHVGGASALAKLIPIEHFLDHGDSVEAQSPEGAKLLEEYKLLAGTKRRVLRLGDRVPVTGIQVDVIASAGKVPDQPLPGVMAAQGGSGCGSGGHPPDRTEAGQSVGLLVTYRKFRFLTLGDLAWEREVALACPVNKIGEVTLWEASAHGFEGDRSGAPAFAWSLNPQIVVVNNAEHKGLSAAGWDTINRIPKVEGIWQEHVSFATDRLIEHNTQGPKIANTSATGHGNWLKAAVTPDGKVTMTNNRNGHSETYEAR